MNAGAARKFDPPASAPEERTPESLLEEIQGIFLGLRDAGGPCKAIRLGEGRA
jgi:hypothetical protein